MAKIKNYKHMKYMLDTNICINILRKKSEKSIARLTSLSIGDVCISSITSSELWFGVQKSSNPGKNGSALRSFLSPFSILDYSNNAAFEYGKIRYYLERRGALIGSMDMLIAAHALAENLCLVTNNEKEFRRVPKLAIEDWT